MEPLLRLVILLPFLGAAFIGLLGFLNPAFRKQEKLIGVIGTLAVAIPFGIIAYTFFNFSGEAMSATFFSWMKAGKIDVSFAYNFDQLSLLMGMIVTGVGSLIHIYSIGYMHGDKGFYKFFAYLNLFIFAMNNLILGDNLVVMFLGWEGVGLCSYLLIGFWYEDMEKAKAAQKAFVANRIGDFAMIIAMFLIFFHIGSLNFADINAGAASLSTNAAFWIGLLVFIAATGKSAQIPLFVWLPDAMAGPTPVSALIHAATMVTSGIYLITRLSPVFSVPGGESVLVIILVVAGATALISALIAVAQNDIKRVLAYSTVSQLGFMFMALGAGAYTAAIFHLMTHAFFKACLFLGSGSVIHAMEHTHTVDDPQDLRTMGGLRKYMPSTSWTFWISTLAIAGIPFLSGFFSKDEILANVFFSGFDHGMVYYIVWGVGTFTAILTAFYMTRLSYLIFEGKERFPNTKSPHENPALMTVPLWILSILAIFGGYLGIPPLFVKHAHWINDSWLGQIINNRNLEELMEANHTLESVLMGLAVVIAVGTVYMTFRFYKKHDLAGDEIVKSRFGALFPVMQGKFFFDEFYQKVLIDPFVWAGKNVVLWFDQQVIDGLVNGTAKLVTYVGEVFKQLQTGLVQNYVLLVSGGVMLILTYLIFG